MDAYKAPSHPARDTDNDRDLDLDTDSPASWAPRSPDLTHFPPDAPDPSTFVHPQHRAYRGSVSSASGPPSSFSPPKTHLESPTLHTRALPAVALQMSRQAKRDDAMLDADYVPEAASASASKQSDEHHNGANAPAALAETIVIKNHFPVARIKRIMQADDDVGKVAQVTPVVVSKALELFMISLVTKAAAEAKNRNSKRVAPLHLKQVVVANEQFDFLSDIVSKVADAPAAADKSDPNAMDVDGGGKKKKAPATRKKKKSEDSDDF